MVTEIWSPTIDLIRIVEIDFILYPKDILLFYQI